MPFTRARKLGLPAPTQAESDADVAKKYGFKSSPSFIQKYGLKQTAPKLPRKELESLRDLLKKRLEEIRKKIPKTRQRRPGVSEYREREL
jgi:hypothetical protein